MEQLFVLQDLLKLLGRTVIGEEFADLLLQGRFVLQRMGECHPHLLFGCVIKTGKLDIARLVMIGLMLDDLSGFPVIPGRLFVMGRFIQVAVCDAIVLHPPIPSFPDFFFRIPCQRTGINAKPGWVQRRGKGWYNEEMEYADERKGMMTLVKRNDPCPCGSGKKYKKCHGRTESGTQLLAEQELKRIMADYISSTPAPGPDRTELSLLVKTWMSRLGGLMKAGAIEGAAYEHYAFNIRRDLWQKHLEQSSANVRDEVKRVLNTWNEPFVMFAELTGKKDGYLILKDVFGDDEWTMTENERIAAPEGTLLFGIVLSDPRVREDAIQPVSTLYSIPADNAAVADRIREFAASLGEQANEAFLESHLLEIFAILHNPAEETAQQQDNGKLEEQAEHPDQAAQEAAAGTEAQAADEPQIGKANQIEDLTDGQNGTLDMLISEMESDGLDRGSAENLRKVVIRYFREENPIVRKPGGIVAGLYLAAQEENLLPGKTFTTKEMAKRFGVSESTAQKYAAAFSGRLK